MGFTKVFSKPNTTATTIAVKVSLTCTPRKMYAANITASEVVIALVINFIIFQIYTTTNSKNSSGFKYFFASICNSSAETVLMVLMALLK